MLLLLIKWNSWGNEPFIPTPWAGQLVMNCDRVGSFIVSLFTFTVWHSGRCCDVFAQTIIPTITHFRRWFVCFFYSYALWTLQKIFIIYLVFWFVYFMSWPYRADTTNATLWPRISNLITLACTHISRTNHIKFMYARTSQILQIMNGKIYERKLLQSHQNTIQR